ncbi:hypothetical protein [Tersicoccus phoenicis]|uniref:hypothetical protein n=1 Tax=Tersicoccus phoenicis TaxID=554083 RepID=UPI0009788FE8|nr:hypothetical protein [Tersicoccus phoenicis]
MTGRLANDVPVTYGRVIDGLRGTRIGVKPGNLADRGPVMKHLHSEQAPIELPPPEGPPPGPSHGRAPRVPRGATGRTRTGQTSAISAQAACPGHRHWLVTGGAVGLVFAYLAGVLASSLRSVTVDSGGPLVSTVPATAVLLIVMVCLAGLMAAVVQFLPALRAGIVGVLGLLLVTGLSLVVVIGGTGTIRATNVWAPSVLLQGAGYNPIGVALVACVLAHGVVVLIGDRHRGTRRISPRPDVRLRHGQVQNG